MTIDDANRPTPNRKGRPFYGVSGTTPRSWPRDLDALAATRGVPPPTPPAAAPRPGRNQLTRRPTVPRCPTCEGHGCKGPGGPPCQRCNGTGSSAPYGSTRP